MGDVYMADKTGYRLLRGAEMMQNTSASFIARASARTILFPINMFHLLGRCSDGGQNCRQIPTGTEQEMQMLLPALDITYRYRSRRN